MTLTNVPAPVGVWTQVHDGTTTATIGIAGSSAPAYAQICQSTSAPDVSLKGFSITSESDVQSIYSATAGAPVFAKALTSGVVIIVNA